MQALNRLRIGLHGSLQRFEGGGQLVQGSLEDGILVSHGGVTVLGGWGRGKVDRHWRRGEEGLDCDTRLSRASRDWLGAPRLHSS